jgi:hypothetical protein
MLTDLGLAEGHLRERQHLQLVVPEQADVDLAPLDQLFDDRRLVVFGVDEFDALLQARVILDDRGLRDTDAAA